MSNNSNEIFVLVWRYGNKAIPIVEGVASICQHKRTQLKGEPQYKGGKMILRTLEGFKKNPLWDGKKKSDIKNRLLTIDEVGTIIDNKI